MMKFLVFLFVFLAYEYACTFQSCAAFQIPNTPAARPARSRLSFDSFWMRATSDGKNMEKPQPLSPNPNQPFPKAIIFDLDGCLWTPEMYEIVYFMGARGAPFRVDPDDDSQLLTCGNQPVRLLGDVRSVLEQVYQESCYQAVHIGISSRTDEPDWARELLEKFQITTDSENGEPVYLRDIIRGPIEIAKDSKVGHFERIRTATGLDFQDMVFFDNEYGNCEQVASLGVSVVYCPDGVTSEAWERGIFQEFPRSDGSVIAMEETRRW